MFSNRFNTKNDPLVEAVQNAMQDGEIRRQAVAQVNEAFGVYSRNAVVREQLAAYDAAIEEAYKCMKEGEKKDEKKEDKPKADYSKMREKMVGKGKDLETTRKIVGEAKKLADKDYDKDGKIESPKDEVWGSRFRAAKMAGKMEEEQIDEISKKLAARYGEKAQREIDTVRVYGGPRDTETHNKMKRRGEGVRLAKAKIQAPRVPATEETQIDEISHKLALKAMKKSDERGEEEYDRDMTDDRLSDPKTHWDRAKRLRGHMKRKFGNKTIKTGGTDNLSPKSYEQGGGERRRADKLKKGPRAGMISAKHRDKLKDNIKYSLGKHKKPNLPEETQIDERNLLKRMKDTMRLGSSGKERVDRISGALSDRGGNWDYKKGDFTEKGKSQVKSRLKNVKGASDYALNKEETQIEEAAYSAKAARAGKDIGKPGKMFSKIAAKAGERYGSEERGKKVAGAILAKMRAKHMKEEFSNNE